MKQNSSRINQKGTGFIVGFHKHGSLSFQVGLTSGWSEVWVNDYYLPKNKWSNIVATYNQKDGYLKLYVNGSCIGEERDETRGFIVPAEVDLLIGENNDPFIVANTFTLNMFSGLMDEVSVYKRSLSEEEIIDLYNSYLKTFDGELPEIDIENISIHRNDFALDILSPNIILRPLVIG